MKKLLLLLLVLVLSTGTKAGINKFRAIGTACTLDYTKTTWSDWYDTNTPVTWNEAKNLIVIHSATVQFIRYSQLLYSEDNTSIGITGRAYDNGKYISLIITYMKSTSYIYLTTDYNDISIMYKLIAL